MTNDIIHQAYADAKDDQSLLTMWDSSDLFTFGQGWNACADMLKPEEKAKDLETIRDLEDAVVIWKETCDSLQKRIEGLCMTLNKMRTS